MSFEQLLKTLEEKCKAEEAAILSAAKNEAKKTNAIASEKAKQLMDNAKAEGKKLGEEQRAEISANARLRARKTLAEARKVLLNKAIQGIEPLLREFAETKEYEKTLLHLAKDCVKALGEDAVLHCRKEDGKILKGSGGFNIGPPVKILGGVVAEAQEGKIKVSNSFETLLENHNEKLKQIAYKALNPTLSNIKPKETKTNAKAGAKQIKLPAVNTPAKVQKIQKPPARKTSSKPLQKGKAKR